MAVVPVTIEVQGFPFEVAHRLETHHVGNVRDVIRHLKQECGGEGWACGDVLEQIVDRLETVDSGEGYRVFCDDRTTPRRVIEGAA